LETHVVDCREINDDAIMPNEMTSDSVSTITTERNEFRLSCMPT